MRNRKYGKNGLGIYTIALMVLCIAIIVLPMNVVADGTFRCVYIDDQWVDYGDNSNLQLNSYVNGTYDDAVGTPTFEWRLDWGNWNSVKNVVPLGGGSFDFNFIMDEDLDPMGGTLWIQATDNSVVTEWHCYY